MFPKRYVHEWSSEAYARLCIPVTHQSFVSKEERDVDWLDDVAMGKGVYALKLAQLASVNRALVAGESIININGHFVPPIVASANNKDAKLPKLPTAEEVDAGAHPEIASWIDEAPMTRPDGLLDVSSPDYMLAFHGIINNQRIAVHNVYEVDGVKVLILEETPVGTPMDSIYLDETSVVVLSWC